MTNKYKKEFDEEIGQSLTPEQIVKIHNANKKMIRKFNQDYNKMVDESEEEIQKLKEEIQKLKDDYQKLLKKLGGVRASRQRELAKCQEEKVELMKGYDEILKFYSDKHLKSMLDYQHFLLCDLDEIIAHLVGDSYNKEIHNKIEKLSQKRYKQFLGITDECSEDPDERSSKELIKDICQSLSCLSEEELKQFKAELDERLNSNEYVRLWNEE